MAPFLEIPLSEETIAGYQRRDEHPPKGQHHRKERFRPLEIAPIEWEQPFDSVVSEIDAYIIKSWKKRAEDSQPLEASGALGPFQFVHIKDTPPARNLGHYIPEETKEPFMSAWRSVRKARTALYTFRSQNQELSFGEEGTYWEQQRLKTALREASLGLATHLNSIVTGFDPSYVGVTLGPGTLALLPLFEFRGRQIRMILPFALMDPEEDENLTKAIRDTISNPANLRYDTIPEKLLLSPNGNFPPINPNIAELTFLRHTVQNTLGGLEKLSQAIEAIARFIESPKELTGISPKDIRKFLKGQYPPSSQLRKSWITRISPDILVEFPNPESN